MEKTRILIVEDEVVVSADLRSKVLKLGYEVCPVVRYGEKALEAVEQERPDLILMDIKLKGEMDGIEAAQSIQQHLGIPVLFVTAYSDSETLNRAKISLPFGYIKKPVKEDDLRINIQMALYRAGMERRLRESEEKCRFLAEHSADVIYRLDIATERYSYVSPSVTTMLGYSEEDIRSMKTKDALTSESYAKQLNKMAEAVVNGRRAPEILELEAVHKEGRIVPVEVNARLIFDENGRPVEIVGVVRDITERKKAERKRMELEARLQQAKKMETISTLAGGIAHEFNNALTVVVGNMELLRMDLGTHSSLVKYVEATKTSTDRMSRLTNQLLAYSRGGRYQARDLALDDLATETLQTLQYTLPPAISVETHIEEGVSYVRADATQMQMVLSAVLANASEAIEGVGHIRIVMENREVDDQFANDHPGLTPGSYVYLAIEDDGKGMNEEQMKRIFDPFFTTKFQGRGMGMAAVYGIVKNHQGWISVDSEPGKGTTVRIYLPAVDAEEREKRETPQTEPAKGAGTILLIEDEEMVIDAVQPLLERLGYRVMTASTGKEALHIMATHDGEIDLALLNMKLPDMEAGMLYPLLMKARPHLKVIVCSGYALDGPAQKILDAGAKGFIQKPFTVAVLAEKVRRLLC